MNTQKCWHTLAVRIRATDVWYLSNVEDFRLSGVCMTTRYAIYSRAWNLDFVD